MSNGANGSDAGLLCWDGSLGVCFGKPIRLAVTDIVGRARLQRLDRARRPGDCTDLNGADSRGHWAIEARQINLLVSHQATDCPPGKALSIIEISTSRA
jgi:hypothetical protein